MGIAVTVRDYLEELDVVYDIVDHPVRMTSIGIAHQAHVPANRLAKGVLLERQGRHPEPRRGPLGPHCRSRAH